MLRLVGLVVVRHVLTVIHRPETFHETLSRFHLTYFLISREYSLKGKCVSSRKGNVSFCKSKTHILFVENS